MSERANVSSADIVGQEGLGRDVSAVAQQVSALEKSMNFQFSSLQTSIQQAAEAIRKETTLEIARVNALLDAADVRAETSIASAVEARTLEIGRLEAMIEAGCKVAADNLARVEENQKREFEIFKIALDKERQIVIERHDGIIANLASSLRSEIKGVGEVGMERMARFMEVKELHWEEHRSTHAQEAEAIRVAQMSADKRIEALNEMRGMVQDQAKEFAPLRMVEELRRGITDRVDREALDARLRFEKVDSTNNERFIRIDSNINERFARIENLINAKFEATSREYRTELRPVQDKQTGNAAVIAALFGAVTIILFAIAIFNFMSRP